MGGSIEPGWYADPRGEDGQLRWWNGEAWTEHVRSLAELRGESGQRSAASADDEATSDLTGAAGGPADRSGDGAAEATMDLGALGGTAAGTGSAMRADPPARPVEPVDEALSTMRIDPDDRPHRPVDPVDDAPATMRIDPPSRPRPASPDAGLEPSTMRIDPPSRPQDARSADVDEDEDDPTADLSGMRRPAIDDEEESDPTRDLTGESAAEAAPRTAVFNPGDPLFTATAAAGSAPPEEPKKGGFKLNKFLGNLKEGLQDYRSELAEERKTRQEEQRRKAEEEAKRRAEQQAKEEERRREQAASGAPAAAAPGAPPAASDQAAGGGPAAAPEAGPPAPATPEAGASGAASAAPPQHSGTGGQAPWPHQRPG
ncbi:DUF2510 domain-containing protein, partial [Marinitenerispora sediminis]